MVDGPPPQCNRDSPLYFPFFNPCQNGALTPPNPDRADSAKTDPPSLPTIPSNFNPGIFKPQVTRCNLSHLPKIPLSLESVIASLQSATVLELKTELPALRIPDRGKVYKEFVIYPKTELRLDQPLVIDEQGQLASGRIKIVGFMGVIGKTDSVQGHSTFVRRFAELKAIRFEEGRIILEGDLSLFATLATPFLPIKPDANGDFDVTNLIKEELNIAKDTPLTLRNLIDALITKKSVAITKIHYPFEQILETLILEARLIFNKPFFRNTSTGQFQIKEAHFSMQGLKQARFDIVSPKFKTGNCEQNGTAHLVSLRLTNINWDRTTNEIALDGQMDIEGARGNLKNIDHDRVRITLTDQEGPEWVFHLQTNMTESLTLDTLELRLLGATQGNRIDAQLDLKGQGRLVLKFPTRPELSGGLHLATSFRYELSPEIHGAAQLSCDTNFELFDVFDLTYRCQLPQGRLTWFSPERSPDKFIQQQQQVPITPEREERFRVNLPPGYRIINGSIHYGNGQAEINIDDATIDHVIAQTIGIAASFILNIRTTDPHGYVKNFTLKPLPNNQIEIFLGEAHLNTASKLESVKLAFPMQSLTDIHDALMTANTKQGLVEIKSANPEKTPYFLQSRARGKILIKKLGWSFDINPVGNQDTLHISRLQYNHQTKEAEFSGLIVLRNRLIPNKLLGHFPLSVVDATNKDQRFDIIFRTHKATLKPGGLIVPEDVEIEVRAVNPTEPPSSFPELEPPPPLDLESITPPSADQPNKAPQEQQAKTTDFFKSMASYFVSAFQAVKRINKLKVFVPYGDGKVKDLPLNSTLIFRPGHLMINAQTQPGPNQREQLKTLSLKLSTPARICPVDLEELLGLGDPLCFAQPDFQLRSFELNKNRRVNADPGFLGIEEPYVQEQDQLDFKFESWEQKSINFILALAGISQQDLHDSGIELSGASITDFENLKTQLILLIKTLSEKDKAKKVKIQSDLPIDWQDSVFDIHLTLNPDPLLLGGQENPRIKIEPGPDSHLMLTRTPHAPDQAFIGEFRLKFVEINGFKKSKPSTLWFHDIHLRPTQVQYVTSGSKTRIVSDLHLSLDTAFRLSGFEGSVSNLTILNPYFEKETTHTFPIQLNTLGIEEISADKMDVSYQDRDIQLILKPLIKRIRAAIFGNQLALDIGELKAEDFYARYKHLGFSLASLMIDDLEALVSLNDKFNPGDLTNSGIDTTQPFHFHAGKLRADHGVLDLLGVSIPLTHAEAQNVAVSMLDTNMTFKGNNIDIQLGGLQLDWLNKLYPDLQIDWAILNQIRLQGNLSPSSAQNKDINLNGDFLFEATGIIKISLHGLEIKTPIKIRFDHVTHLSTQNNKLDKLYFKGGHIEFLDLDLDFVSKVLGIKVGSLGSQKAHLILDIPHGAIDFSNSGSNKPIIDLPRLDLHLSGYSNVELGFKVNKQHHTLNYQNGTLSLDTKFGLKIFEDKDKMRRTEVPTYDLNLKLKLIDPK